MRVLYSVPDLEFDGFVGGCDHFRAELNTDGWVVIKLELFLKKLQKHATFTDTWL